MYCMISTFYTLARSIAKFPQSVDATFSFSSFLLKSFIYLLRRCIQKYEKEISSVARMSVNVSIRGRWSLKFLLDVNYSPR